MNVAHNSWPIIVMPYNFPPWLCMKQPHMMMILLIDGPSSPGNNIDVYLRLLVDELNELWENGVQTYDAETNQMFQLYAVLLWTINDFPAYANLSRWSTKGHSSRGPTLMHASDWNPSGGILHIVPNELNQVVDGYTPLALVWVNTNADESIKKFVLVSVGKKWREWKAKVKQMGYTPFDNDADRLTHRPKRVHEHQWRSLVYYWGTRKAQKKSTKNKEIRKKKTLNHITGRKPFSVVRVEETNKKNGVPATRLETQMKDLGAQSNATDGEIITQVLGPERPDRVRTYGLGPSPTDVFGGGYRQSQEQTRIIQMQVQEQLNQYKAQMEMQMKEMMDAMLNQQKVQMEMQGTIQAQQAQIAQLESQQAMGGPVAPAATHVHSQQQSHAYTSSFNCHRSSEEVHISKKEKKKKKKK
ncbi:uncharacterized protein LOC114287384 [Camellia sinensis]|uniref:uncharacterized protein LOC114287384 n=1 Tax=Camellia sinensis TaxID=4442 RepID=UPI0010369440|nr:uncharacterized protein LOC114287384 [Camellia sinensis]